MKKSKLISGLTMVSFTLISVWANCQLQIPRIDIEVKGAQTFLLPDNSQEVDNASLQGYSTALHFQFNQYLAAGLTYSRSLAGQVHYSHQGATFRDDGDARYLRMGLDVRVSAGRSRKWRPYLSMNYGKIELVEEREGYRISGKSTGFGATAGVMRRLSNKVYLTLAEGGITLLSEKLFWIDSKVCVEFKTGVLVNFGRKK